MSVWPCTNLLHCVAVACQHCSRMFVFGDKQQRCFKIYTNSGFPDFYSSQRIEQLLGLNNFTPLTSQKTSATQKLQWVTTTKKHWHYETESWLCTQKWSIILDIFAQHPHLSLQSLCTWKPRGSRGCTGGRLSDVGHEGVKRFWWWYQTYVHIYIYVGVLWLSGPPPSQDSASRKEHKRNSRKKNEIALKGEKMSSFSGSSYDQSARFAGVSRSCTHSLFSYTVSTCWLLTVQPLEASVTGARS